MTNRTSARRVIAGLLALAILAISASVVTATKPDPEHKVALCHRTASDTNPYVYIEVDEASLDAHLNNLPGHPAKEWKTDGTFRGVAHVAGDLKSDYLATSEADCMDTQTEATPTPDPTVDPTPDPTVEPTPAPTSSIDVPATATPTPRATPREDVPNTAMSLPTGNNGLLFIGFLLLFAAGLIAVVERIRTR